jgi:protein SCO1/2
VIKHFSSSRRHLLLGAAAVMAMPLAGCEKQGAGSSQGPSGASASFRGTDITGADYGNGLSLPDHNGQVRTMKDFKGKVTVVFFGFTQCPDVCPSTMAELAQVKKALGPDGDRLQGVFITVDPERDTPELLKSYMSGFDPSFVALRGTLEQTAATAKAFKVFFSKTKGTSEGSYGIDHTAGSYVFDADGKARIFVRYGTGIEALTADIKTLLAEA